MCIRRTQSVGSIRSVRAVHTDMAFSFLPCPLEKIEHQAHDKVGEKPRKVNVERLFLFLGEFLFNSFVILLYGGMVVITISGRKLSRWADKMSFQRNSLCEDSFSSRIVHWWKIFWWITFSSFQQRVKRVVPVTMAVGLFSSQPANEVTVIEMETQ